jgi:hypothetical protein
VGKEAGYVGTGIFKLRLPAYSEQEIREMEDMQRRMQLQKEMHRRAQLQELQRRATRSAYDDLPAAGMLRVSSL